VVVSGKGDLVNVRSKSAAFTCSQRVAFGTKVELAIFWPALLHGVTHIKLVITGTVVRSDGDVVALEFGRYEFRTQKASTM